MILNTQTNIREREEHYLWGTRDLKSDKKSDDIGIVDVVLVPGVTYENLRTYLSFIS